MSFKNGHKVGKTEFKLEWVASVSRSYFINHMKKHVTFDLSAAYTTLRAEAKKAGIKLSVHTKEVKKVVNPKKKK